MILKLRLEGLCKDSGRLNHCYLENLKVEEGGETYTHTLNYLLLSMMS